MNTVIISLIVPTVPKLSYLLLVSIGWIPKSLKDNSRPKGSMIEARDNLIPLLFDLQVSQQLAFNSQRLRVPKEFSLTPVTTTTTAKPTTTSTTSSPLPARRPPPFGPQPRSVVLPPRRRLSFFSFDTLHRHPHPNLSPFHHHRPRDLPENR